MNKIKHGFSWTRRAIIRVVSFTSAAILALTGALICSTLTANQYRMQLEYTYERGLTELTEYLNNIEITLTKGVYAGTAQGIGKLAVNLRSQADSAKVCLSQIPSYGTDLEQTYKFLSQVGEYALSLSRQLDRGKSINEEQHKKMMQLSQSAQKLTASIGALSDQMNQDGAWKTQIETAMKETNGGALESGLQNLENTLSDYPTLLYDGPFSEHILQAKPLLLENLSNIDLSKATQIAAKAAQTTTEALGQGTLQKANTIPSYQFYTDTLSVAVTQQGGIVSFFNNNRTIEETKLQYDACIEKAKAYLDTLGLGTFKESYYSVFEGVCLINFAYMEEDVICYTDLIKIGVALDNGEIVSYNAQGYIMNHHPRTLQAPAYSEEQARAVLSPYLTVKNSSKAIIPADTREPLLCYEFLCETEQEKEILVYVNTQTLEEEELLILLKTDGGVLTL